MAKQNRTRRVFSAEFKLNAVRRVDERQAQGGSLSQIGREQGVGPDLLRRWRQQSAERVGAAPRDVFPGQGRLPMEQEELRRLQRQVPRLQQENEFLKKAAADSTGRCNAFGKYSGRRAEAQGPSRAPGAGEARGPEARRTAHARGRLGGAAAAAFRAPDRFGARGAGRPQSPRAALRGPGDCRTGSRLGERHRTSPPVRAGSISASCWIWARAGSWGGRCTTRWLRRWCSMRGAWRSTNAGPALGCCTTPIAAANIAAARTGPCSPRTTSRAA